MSYTPGAWSRALSQPLGAPSSMYVHRSKGFKQAKPIDRNKVLGYKISHIWVDKVLYKNPPYEWGSTYHPYNCLIVQETTENFILNEQLYSINKAREKFLGVMHSKAELGASLAESRDSLRMIENRARTLYRAYKALRQGNLGDALKLLGVRPKPGSKLRTRSRDASRLWLEYWFGWAPLVADIGSAVDILQGEIPKEHVDVFVRTSGNKSVTRTRRTCDADYDIRTGIQADIWVTNPDLYRATALGFMNLPLIAWEFATMSFLVDWFLPVGQYLSERSDFYGLTVTNASYNQLTKLKGVEYRTNSYMYEFHGMDFRRVPGIPGNSFVLRPWSTSSVRAATAVSLLIQLFISDPYSSSKVRYK